MNAATGYVLIVLAILNLAGLLLLFRRLGAAAQGSSQSVPERPVQAESKASPAEAAIPADALANMLRRLDHRLGDIEDQVRRQPAVTVASEPSATSDRALALAQRLARQGATPQNIAETCGISLTEAELLHRLHAPK
jgi:DNA-binding NarL/FixJ family response regulator